MNAFWAARKAYQARLDALGERDKRVLDLARKVRNAMVFACQGAEQGNTGMEERYARQADEAMRELEAVLLEGRP